MFDIDRVGLGGRLKGAGQLQFATVPTDTDNRMFIGYIGELIVFTRALSAMESARVAAYLKRKWFASAIEMPMLAEEATLTSAAIDVPAGAAAVAGTFDLSGAEVHKSGEGTLVLGAEVTSEGTLRVAEGRLDLTGTSAVSSRASVWLDAADVSTLTMEGAQVSAVQNKGRAGGAFELARGRNGTLIPYPGYLANAINGRGALVFDTNAALTLGSYTNETSPRAIHMYAVMQGHGGDLNSPGKGKWGGPFSLYDARQNGDDQNTRGSFQITETYNGNGVNQANVYMGTANYGATLPADGLNQPYLFVIHQEGISYNFAYEWADTPTDQVTVRGKLSDVPMSSTCVNLGGRSTTGGVLQWEAVNNANNRTWAGYIGELVILDRKLTTAEERALLGYLRRKWLNKGDGSTEPPAFLSGNYGVPNLATVGLSLANGTAVACGDARISLANLTSEGTVEWTKVWDGLTSAHATCFDVSGNVSLAQVALDYQPLPKEALVVGFSNSSAATPTWRISSDGAAACATVSSRASGYWLTRAGLVLMFR